jgi:hypothetical protein
VSLTSATATRQVRDWPRILFESTQAQGFEGQRLYSWRDFTGAVSLDIIDRAASAGSDSQGQSVISSLESCYIFVSAKVVF